MTREPSSRGTDVWYAGTRGPTMLQELFEASNEESGLSAVSACPQRDFRARDLCYGRCRRTGSTSYSPMQCTRIVLCVAYTKSGTDIGHATTSRPGG
eukprot:3542937-Rhodomonas_salina.5